jgi:acyl carrier protein
MAGPPNDATAEIIGMLKKAIWEVDQKKLDGLSAGDAISALGIDSVAMLEVIGYLEDELDVHVTDDKLSSVKTVGDLAAVIIEARGTV